MDLEHERRLSQVEQRSKSNTHRIDKLEQTTEAISRLAASMEVMSQRQGQVAESVDRLDRKVTVLESQPAKRWEALADKLMLTTAAAIVGYILSRIGF